MFKKENYIMNSETMSYQPVYDHLGNLCTKVMERDTHYITPIAPTDLMDYNLRYFGTSLRGAFDGSKMILGKLNKNPIIVHEGFNILWFPSKSPFHKECAWYAVHHIEDYIAIDQTRTKIIFNNGQEIIADISVRALEYRIQRSFLLKYRLAKRTKQMLVQNGGVKIFQRMGMDMNRED